MNLVNSLKLGGAAAAILAASALQAQADNINLAVASNFYGQGTTGPSPIYDLISAFQAANPGSGYTVTVTDNGSTGTLESHIVTNSNSANVDLFLAADTAHPNDIVTNHSTLASGSVFNYAIGTLALWSNDPSTDVSGGYSSSSFPLVAIANTSAPYGVAAQTILTGRFGLAAPLTTNSLVSEFANIDLTYAAVSTQAVDVGFIALSQICHSGSFPTSGTVHVYPPTETTSPFTVNYSPIVQAGLKIVRAARPNDTELNAFVAFLQDYTVSPTPSPMVTVLQSYCYGVP